MSFFILCCKSRRKCRSSSKFSDQVQDYEALKSQRWPLPPPLEALLGVHAEGKNLWPFKVIRTIQRSNFRLTFVLTTRPLALSGPVTSSYPLLSSKKLGTLDQNSRQTQNIQGGRSPGSSEELPSLLLKSKAWRSIFQFVSHHIC